MLGFLVTVAMAMLVFLALVGAIALWADRSFFSSDLPSFRSPDFRAAEDLVDSIYTETIARMRARSQR